MTAYGLIADIFSRNQEGVAGNVRRITERQLAKLRELIYEDPEAGAVRNGVGRSIVWTPAGRYKYVLTDDVHWRTLSRLPIFEASETGSLF